MRAVRQKFLRRPKRFISLAGWLFVAVSSLGLHVLLIQTTELPLAIAVSQVLLGIPLWIWCFDLALRARPRIGWLWILPLAPLLRQMFWVLLPSVTYYVLPLRAILPTPYVDIQAGSLIMTLGNYSLFFALQLGLKLLHAHSAPDQLFAFRSAPFLLAAGVGLSVIWIIFRLGDQTAELLSHENRFGSSLTAGWGYTGLCLVLGASWPKHNRVSFRQLLTWAAIVLLFLLPLITVGQRLFILYPMVIGLCVVLIWVAASIRWVHVLAVIGGGLLVLWLVFVVAEGIRQEYFWSGQNAPASELPNLIGTGLSANRDRMISEVNTRLSSMIVVTELTYSHRNLFPVRNWTQTVAGFVEAFDTRLVNWTQLLGLDSTMDGLNPGRYIMAQLYGGESTAAYPPEAEFYLSGGLVGVFIGSAALGWLVCGWLWLLRRLKLNRPCLMALVIGTFFAELLLAELYSRLVAVLTWRLLVLVVLLKFWELLFTRVLRPASGQVAV